MVEKPAVHTLSNAMDVAKPSNFIRIEELYKVNSLAVKKEITSFSISDEATKMALQEIYNQYQYVSDPHTAVGYAALQKHTFQKEQQYVVLATAHPLKFDATIKSVLGEAILQPFNYLLKLEEPKNKIAMQADFNALKDLLMK
jgi:threonine synthase